MQKKYLATANTSSGGFGSSNAPKPVDMGGFGSGGFGKSSVGGSGFGAVSSNNNGGGGGFGGFGAS